METSLAPDLPQVMGDRIQLQQVLLNLPWVIVTLEDAGIGFGQDEAARLFEAFYTTKPGGVGMGRSISRSIIDSPGCACRSARSGS